MGLEGASWATEFGPLCSQAAMYQRSSQNLYMKGSGLANWWLTSCMWLSRGEQGPVGCLPLPRGGQNLGICVFAAIVCTLGAKGGLCSWGLDTGGVVGWVAALLQPGSGECMLLPLLHPMKWRQSRGGDPAVCSLHGVWALGLHTGARCSLQPL